MTQHQSTTKKARLTHKEFQQISQHQNFTPNYFVKVKEAAEEFGIAIHPLNQGGYLLIDIQNIATGPAIFNLEYINKLQEKDERLLYKLLQEPSKDGASTNKKLTQISSINSQVEAFFIT